MDIKVYDDPENHKKPLRLNFTIQEYMGSEVLKSRDGGPILSRDGLALGDEIFGHDIFAWRSMTVTRLEGDRGYAEDEWVGVSLEFGKDDRKCWVAVCWINLDAVRRWTP